MRYLTIILVVVCLPILTNAQSFYKYLGNGTTVPDSLSPSLQIRFNDLGFADVTNQRLSKSEQRLISMGAPQSQINKLMNFPHQDYGKWVESSYRSALSQFTACGGTVSVLASHFDPSTIYVSFEPTVFTDPNLPLPDGEVLAGEYIPAGHMIRAVGFYKSETDGELAYLPSVLTWEWGNAIAEYAHVTPEPRGANWPCQ
jgi:hypothetical protein